MKTLLQYCKDYIIDHIDDYVGDLIYACDFSMTLTESANIDGSLTYSTKEAKDYLREWWQNCSAYWEYEKSNFGQNLHNPFDNPEAYMVCMVIEGCGTILSRCPVIDENWNNKIEFTEEIIQQIKEFVEQYEDEDLF